MFGKQAISRLFQVQSILPAIFHSNYTTTTTTLSSKIHHPDIDRTISFWFSLDPKQWFSSSTDLDRQCHTSFGRLITQARSNDLDSWQSTSSGTLALILLLDQFPRNVFRGTSEAFATDPKACSIATSAIAKGFDRERPLNQQPFFYLPLMHAEDLLAQVASLALYEAYEARQREAEGQSTNQSDFARSHTNTILRFGRFPGRNVALGRESTEEEMEFLKENPGGFAK